MDIHTTPWNFFPADQAATSAITSIVRNGNRSALITTGVHGLSSGALISVQGTATYWNGGYRVEAVPSTTTLLVRIEDPRSTLANLGAVGNIYTAAYMQSVFIQQALWDGAVAGGLLLTDLTGQIVWNPSSPTFSGTLTYMKAEPVNGLVLNTLATGTLQISVH